MCKDLVTTYPEFNMKIKLENSCLVLGHKVRKERMPLQIRCTNNNNTLFISYECGRGSTYTNRMQFTPVGILLEYMYICKNLLKSVSYIQRTVRFVQICMNLKLFLTIKEKVNELFNLIKRNTNIIYIIFCQIFHIYECFIDYLKL